MRVSLHALNRIRQRWRGASVLDDGELAILVNVAIKRARANGTRVKAPGGYYVPFQIQDDEGFVVYKDGTVTTAMPKEWCSEIVEFLKRRDRGQIRVYVDCVPDDAAE